MSTVTTEERTLGHILHDIGTEAAARNTTTEAFLETLLEAYRAGETGGMELGPKHREEIADILGAGIGSPKELVDRVRRLATIQVDSTRIRLKPMLIERLKTRARHRTMPEFLKEIVPEGLERYVGMR